jgi:hypothetical protein
MYQTLKGGMPYWQLQTAGNLVLAEAALPVLTTWPMSANKQLLWPVHAELSCTAATPPVQF